MTVTVHQAKTHLSRYLTAVEDGEEIVIARGKREIAALVPLRKRAARTPRPRVGETLDRPFIVSSEALSPMSDSQLREFGL
jgi:prevent-host-death family protein